MEIKRPEKMLYTAVENLVPKGTNMFDIQSYQFAIIVSLF